MSVYGASFVQVGSDGPARFAATCRLIREWNASWLAAAPTNLAVEHTVRISDGAAWMSIQNAIGDELLRQLSADLDTGVITIYACDEIILRFSYVHLEGGRPLRRLEYGDEPHGAPSKWTKVEGERQAWESVLFSPRLMTLYRKYFPDKIVEACRGETIKVGCEIPWASDGDIVAEIAERLQLPWEPLGNTFPPAVQSEVIPGSPDRWKQLYRTIRKPWWKLW